MLLMWQIGFRDMFSECLGCVHERFMVLSALAPKFSGGELRSLVPTNEIYYTSFSNEPNCGTSQVYMLDLS
jgi:hypothetical protein